MKQLITLIVILFLTATCNNKLVKLAVQKNGFIEFDEYGIREKPILNREYIVFLSWYIDTYGFSYPEKILQILPENSIESNFILSTDYNHLTTKSSGILNQYILNPKYLNYPLIGLRIDQILEMQKWLSDRYNENRLIDLGILNFNPLQMDEDCFVTETYLVDQYIGDMKRDKYINWADKEFLPVFRLPFKEELARVKNRDKAFNKMQSYKFNENDFLWRWDKHYISTNTQKNELILNLYELLTFNIKSNYVVSKNSTGDFIIKEEIFKNSFYPKLEGIRDIEDLSTYPFEEKGKYGHMDFIIIGNDKTGKPVAISKKLKEKDAIQYTSNKISTVVYSKIIN